MELVREGMGRMLQFILLQGTVWEHSSLLGSERKAPYGPSQPRLTLPRAAGMRGLFWKAVNPSNDRR